MGGWRYSTANIRHKNCPNDPYEKINKLIDQSDATSLSINQNMAELATILDDLKNDEIFIKDENMKLDLINIFESLHTTYLHSARRISDYQTSHSALLLEFKVALQTDLQIINKCILHQQICFYRHGHFFCAKDCFLTSEKDFAINFKMQEYLKLHVLHVDCMHVKTGLISFLSNKMFFYKFNFFQSNFSKL